MTAPTPPGWYPDPAQPVNRRYWDGYQWTSHAAVPVPKLRHATGTFLEQTVLVSMIALFGAITVICVLAGEWEALVSVGILAMFVGGLALLVLVIVRAKRQKNERLSMRRVYEQQIINRCDWQNASFDGQYGPPADAADGAPDAEQMRRQAWQPDLDAASAVRPNNPAPWHVVTQYPTRSFRASDDSAPPK